MPKAYIVASINVTDPDPCLVQKLPTGIDLGHRHFRACGNCPHI